MSEIKPKSTLQDVAAIVSSSLEQAGIAATLSGGAAVSIYSDNQYQSKDLNFVTAAMLADVSPVLGALGFVHTGVPRIAQFSHPLVEWYVEFPATPISFGHLYVTHEQCAIIELPAGRLRIVTPTQSVMDRLAAAISWNDAQSREQAVLVAANQEIDWKELRRWYENEGETDEDFKRFHTAVELARPERNEANPVMSK
ncbi:MAG: hypothetical protein GXP15_01400 [Gammaproteobacteria bacterium]|nr:hypothetical protein [Gammaproteobacteria bacterium]